MDEDDLEHLWRDY